MHTDILDKFTSHLKNALAKAYALAVELDSTDINPEHLLLSLLLQKGSIGGEVLRKSSMSGEELRRVLKLADDLDSFGMELEEDLVTDKDDDDTPKLSADSKRVIEKAVLTANINEHKYVGTEHLLAGLLQIGSPAIAAVLAEQHVNASELQTQIEEILKSTSKFPEITETFEVGEAPMTKTEKEDDMTVDEVSKRLKQRSHVKTPALDFFAVDLTDPAVQENIDPVIGREEEIDRLIQILCRRQKNNPVLLGEPGVGKTAIIEGLAKRILHGEVPDILSNKRIVALDIGLMLAGTIYRGEFEGRVKQIIDEMKSDPDLVLFIDELHNIMGTGSTSGSLDAANILKPALARGDMRCIGATTLAEFKKHIEGDGALERRFQPITVEPPSPDVAVQILKGLRVHYEGYHGVTITDEAIRSAVDLSERYVPDRFLPDKAIDLIDEASAAIRIANSTEGRSRKVRSLQDELKKTRQHKERAVANENFIEALEKKTKEREIQRALDDIAKKETTETKKNIGTIGHADIARVIARATGIPLTELIASEKDRLLNLEDHLRHHIVGQEDALRSVSELVRRAKAGIAHPNRPLASFLFLGPSGVGKTELAKILTEKVFQDPDALIRIDMSEFSEGFNMSKLVGAPAGYVGYKESTKLTDVVKRRPYSLVLFDEIEKAHGDVHNLLLQILEDGHITDATGRKINFKNTIIIMTSNVGGGQFTANSIGFSEAKGGEITAAHIRETHAGIMKEVENAFRPEFINRIDKIVVFNPLSAKDLKSIVKIQITELNARVKKDYGISITATPKTMSFIAEKSWDPRYGARGVRRQIQDLIENPLAKELLAERYRKGDAIQLTLKNDTIAFVKKKAHARPKAKLRSRG